MSVNLCGQIISTPTAGHSFTLYPPMPIYSCGFLCCVLLFCINPFMFDVKRDINQKDLKIIDINLHFDKI